MFLYYSSIVSLLFLYCFSSPGVFLWTCPLPRHGDSAGLAPKLDGAGSSVIQPVWPRPAFTLLPITPQRLAEKRARHDHFFATVMKEGVILVSED